MLTLPPSVRIYMAAEAVDLPRGFDGLSAATRHILRRDPLSGHLFCFMNARRNRMKVLVWEPSGFLLVYNVRVRAGQRGLSGLAREVVRRLYVTAIRKRLSTSLSDNQAYPQVCNCASVDYRAFNSFRRHPVYNQILEHVTKDEGAQYLEEIALDRAVYERLPDFRDNDLYGGPRTYSYPGIGSVSPTTLRYIKVLADLKKHFSSLDGLRICEIGVGYGGLCRIIDSYFSPAAYRLVDIRPALRLSQRFLDHFVMKAVLAFSTMNELSVVSDDLVISNYAFTELPRTVQDVYLRKVILNAARGYITYNEITPDHFRSYRRDELLRMIPRSHVLPEKPLTHPKNCIIVWGDA